MSLNESTVEEAALEWFGELGYAVGHGPQMAPGEATAERASFGEVVLVGRLREALRRLNAPLPAEAVEEALRKVMRVATPSLVQTNRAFHRLLRDCVDVEHTRPDGSTKYDKAGLVDFSSVRAGGGYTGTHADCRGKREEAEWAAGWHNWLHASGSAESLKPLPNCCSIYG